MNLEKKENISKSYKNTKHAFIYILELILFSIFLATIIITSMNTPFTTSIKNVHIKQQELRAISIFFGFTYLMTYVGFIVNVSLKPDISKQEKIWTGFGFIPIIGVINGFYYFIKSIQQQITFKYFKYIFSSVDTNKKISYNHVINCIKNKNIKKNDYLFWMTIIFSFVFLVSIVSIIFIFLMLDVQESPIDPRNLWWFKKFSYFTEWSNFSCFIVCFLFLLNHRWRIFDDGKFMNSIAIYISFVFLIFWLVLLPGSAIINSNFSLSGKKVSSIISTGWFHLIMPVSYIIFVGLYNYFWKSPKDFQMKNYIKTIFYFPLTYCLYAYTLPFVTNITIYGLMTNTNPNNIPFGDKYIGEYWHFVFIPLLLLVFLGLIWTFSTVTKKICLKNTNKQIEI